MGEIAIWRLSNRFWYISEQNSKFGKDLTKTMVFHEYLGNGCRWKLCAFIKVTDIEHMFYSDEASLKYKRTKLKKKTRKNDIFSRISLKRFGIIKKIFSHKVVDLVKVKNFEVNLFSRRTNSSWDKSVHSIQIEGLKWQKYVKLQKSLWDFIWRRNIVS